MSGSKTAYLSKALLDHVLGGPNYVRPANIWFVLSTSAFDPNATGSACDEVVGGAYGRLEFANDTTTWGSASAAAPSLKSNNDDLVWPTATASWGTPLSVYVADAATAGHLLYGADLSDTAEVAISDVFKILAGTYIFSED